MKGDDEEGEEGSVVRVRLWVFLGARVLKAS